MKTMKKKAACMGWVSPSIEEVGSAVTCVICGDRTISILSRRGRSGRLEMQAVCRGCRSRGYAWFSTPVYKAGTNSVDDGERMEMRAKAIRRWLEIMR